MEHNFADCIRQFGGPPVIIYQRTRGEPGRGKPIPRELAEIYLRALRAEYPQFGWYLQEVGNDGLVQQARA